jgi:hypothetical protein
LAERVRAAVQMKALSELGWLLSLGTAGQLFAALVVLASLLLSPWSSHSTSAYATGPSPPLTAFSPTTHS